jgi:hypothetical protein
VCLPQRDSLARAASGRDPAQYVELVSAVCMGHRCVVAPVFSVLVTGRPMIPALLRTYTQTARGHERSPQDVHLVSMIPRAFLYLSFGLFLDLASSSTILRLGRICVFGDSTSADEFSIVVGHSLVDIGGFPVLNEL